MTDDLPTARCPYCRQLCTCWADECGPLAIKTGPFVCRGCGAVEGWGEDPDEGDAPTWDQSTGWHRPGTVAPKDRDFEAGMSRTSEVRR